MGPIGEYVDRPWEPLCSRTIGDDIAFEIMLSIEYASAATSRRPPRDNQLDDFFAELEKWVKPPEMAMLVPSDGLPIEPSIMWEGDPMPSIFRTFRYQKKSTDSGNAACRPIYDNLFETKKANWLHWPWPLGSLYVHDDDIEVPLRCPLVVMNTTLYETFLAVDILSPALTASHWHDAQVDLSLQAFIGGGADADAIRWVRKEPLFISAAGTYTTDLSNYLGIDLIGDARFRCSLKTPCRGNFALSSVGSRTTLGVNRMARSTWSLYALQAFTLFNQQLRTQWSSKTSELV